MTNKTKILNLFFAGLLVLMAGGSHAAFPTQIDGQSLPTLAPILERSMPAVVNISTTKLIRGQVNPLMQDPFFQHFFQLPRQTQKQQKNSLGSGVIVDSENGYVLTNNHVIDKADKIMVTLSDGRQLNAKLIGTDPAADVAVIQIPTQNLTALPIADSNDLRVGDFVIAIGNPFGLGQTVTSGIISALGRTGLGIEGYEDFIQTDASINPGNSGGALINLRGEFIGMNTAILAPSGGNVGIGFAIPANMAMTLKNTLVKHGEVRRGLLGVTTQDLTHDLIQAFELKNTSGAIITRIEAGSPAEEAGLQPGDIIVAVNDDPIKNSHAIRNMIGLMQIGDDVDISIVRNDEKMRLRAEIGKPKVASLKGEDLHRGLQGTMLINAPKDQVEGVLISKIQQSSNAWQVGLQPGDVIVSANRYRIHNLKELSRVVNPQSALLINIQRGRDAFFLVLK